MTMQENVRFIEGLRRRGWTDTEITDFMIEIESGIIKGNSDENGKPQDIPNPVS